MHVEKTAYDLQQKYSKRMEKRMQGKPQAVKIIMSSILDCAFELSDVEVEIESEQYIVKIVIDE